MPAVPRKGQEQEPRVRMGAPLLARLEQPSNLERAGWWPVEEVSGSLPPREMLRREGQKGGSRFPRLVRALAPTTKTPSSAENPPAAVPAISTCGQNNGPRRPARARGGIAQSSGDGYLFGTWPLPLLLARTIPLLSVRTLSWFASLEAPWPITPP